METVEERYGMTVPVGMTVWRTMRTHGTYPGTITRTGWPVRMVMAWAIIGAIVRTMIVARAVVTGAVVTGAMVRTRISTWPIVVALIAGTVVAVAGTVMVAAILMAIISGATMRRTRRTLSCSIAGMASIGLTAACLRINDGSGEHSHRHYEGCNRVQYLFHNLLLHSLIGQLHIDQLPRIFLVGIRRFLPDSCRNPFILLERQASPKFKRLPNLKSF